VCNWEFDCNFRSVTARAQARTAEVRKEILRLEKLRLDEKVRDYAALSRLGHITRAPITQIMNLLKPAPDMVESLTALKASQSVPSGAMRAVNWKRGKPNSCLSRWEPREGVEQTLVCNRLLESGLSLIPLIPHHLVSAPIFSPLPNFLLG